MLKAYEKVYMPATPAKIRANDAITNKRWGKFFEEKGIDGSKYRMVELLRPDNQKVVNFRPTEMIRTGAYPFRSLDEN